MSKTDVTKLRELAEAINGNRPMPLASADLCRRVANEMELANARIDRLLDGLRKAQTALAEATKADCIWQREGSDCGCYNTTCGHGWYFTDGDLNDNNAIYCPFCGGKIVEAGGEG